jgi:DNA polymerase III delta prime subunit
LDSKHEKSSKNNFIGSLNLSPHIQEALSVELANAISKSDFEIVDGDFVDCTTSHCDSLDDSFYLIEG